MLHLDYDAKDSTCDCKNCVGWKFDAASAAAFFHTDLKLVKRKLKRAGYRAIFVPHARGFFYKVAPGCVIHIIPSHHVWLNDALFSPAGDAAGLPILALAYLILLKLDSYRAQDWADVSRMVGLATKQERREVRRVIAKYSPEDLDDLESLVFLGKKELESPTKKSAKRKSKK